MKIKNVDVDIGDIVLIIEKYNKNFHELEHDRKHIGFVMFMDSSKNIALTKKMLINPRQKDIKGWRDFFKIFYNIGISNYGTWGTLFLNESQIKSIKILK